MSRFNEESAKYLEHEAAPYFIGVFDYYEAVDCYELLETHYKKTNKGMKSLQMAKAIRDIYARCLTRCEER